MKRRKLTADERMVIYAKYNGRCCYCGCQLDFDSMEADHMISMHNHGQDVMDNIVPSCHECNYYKKGSNPDGFRKKLKRAFSKKSKGAFVKMLEVKYDGWNGIFYFEMVKCNDRQNIQ